MSFESLYLRPELISSIKESGYLKPTAIQEAVIPAVQRGRDILASAQTGSGKTASFALPLLNLFDEVPAPKNKIVNNLVLVPTRELAQQVLAQFKHYGQNLKTRCSTVYGGVAIEPQIQHLSRGVHVLIATPGRLLDLMERKAVDLSQLQTLVLDEADRMLDLGFTDDLEKIRSALPKQRQNLMFSATFSSKVRDLAKESLSDPLEIDTAPTKGPSESVEHWLHPVDQKQKSKALISLIQHHDWSQVFVFCKTKRGADKLVQILNKKKLKAIAIHGDKSQTARTNAISDFKQGRARILVATDVAARGIDVEKVPAVINHDLPRNPEDYIHRIGRTGRAGHTGQAVSLASAEDFDELKGIERLLEAFIERRSLTGFSPTVELPESPEIKPRKAPKKNKNRKTNKAKVLPAGHGSKTKTSTKRPKQTPLTRGRTKGVEVGDKPLIRQPRRRTPKA